MRGFIYKIESDCKQILYIGSTTQKLDDRFARHNRKTTCIISKYLTSSNYLFSNGCELIKEYETADRQHLLAYEQLWMNVYRNRIVNKKKAYALLDKEYKKQYDKQYKKQKIICDCGSESIAGHLPRHQRTAKHQILLESKEQLIECLSFA